MFGSLGSYAANFVLLPAFSDGFRKCPAQRHANPSETSIPRAARTLSVGLPSSIRLTKRPVAKAKNTVVPSKAASRNRSPHLADCCRRWLCFRAGLQQSIQAGVQDAAGADAQARRRCTASCLNWSPHAIGLIASIMLLQLFLHLLRRLFPCREQK